MGLYEINDCIFTGLPVEHISSDRGAITYILEINKIKIQISLPFYATKWPISEKFFKQNKHIFVGLLFNNKWFNDSKKIISIDDLKNLVQEADYPKTPNEKLDSLFLELCSMQQEDGQKIILVGWDLWKILYFKSQDELEYYLQYLDTLGLIEAEYGSATLNGKKVFHSFRITFQGLNKVIDLKESGKNSNLCFIAMSFRPETMKIRQAIKSALLNTGFRAIIIDEENIDSEKTINDAIISNLKKCNFCIADFSFHSNGVYFESGFALGQGKKVIYTCSKEEFENAHFDIKPLQHIIYKSSQQLEIDLINKIEAWIK